MAHQYRIVALLGEGIGLEVVVAAMDILQYLAQMQLFTISVTEGLIGEPAFNQLGSYFPETTAQLCAEADGILLGAVSKGGLLELRKHFDLFINLRSVKPSCSLFSASPLRIEKLKGVDILFVRELVSGIYFGPAGRSVDEQGAYGYHTMRYYDREIRRIAKVALKKAQARRGLITVAHKENALPNLPWSQLVLEEAQAFPDVVVEPMLVDTLAMQLVMNPQHFDVILAGNLFGDILSDIGGAIAGSIGLLGSASLNAAGFGLYEPVHGTAPDIAGKGIANPMGMLASVGLMLEQWGEQVAANCLADSQERLLAKGYRTADLYTSPLEQLVTTQEWVNLLKLELSDGGC
jgi:3-isopropylmalate dehydrogenase